MPCDLQVQAAHELCPEEILSLKPVRPCFYPAYASSVSNGRDEMRLVKSEFLATDE